MLHRLTIFMPEDLTGRCPVWEWEHYNFNNIMEILQHFIRPEGVFFFTERIGEDEILCQI